MKLYFEAFKLLINRFILRFKTGKAIRIFCEHMGITYVKLAQILATQNYGKLFTEKDRVLLSSVCDNYKPIKFKKIKKILEKEYDKDLEEIFNYIEPFPTGSASISQVHKAILKSGEVVALKIKRKDITNTIEKDLKIIKKLVHRFGRLFKFKNFMGSEQALNLYLKWLYEETDFVHEKENIKLYQKFASNVNGKIEGQKEIKVPKLYEDLCTENIIVMEFIESKTINKMAMNDDNKLVISTAINSYVKLSFYAFFHDEQIVFHGDPHNGNVFIDDDGNIGFLDMGLIYALSDKESDFLRKLLFSSYSGNYEKLYNLLIPYGTMTDVEKAKFKEDVHIFCNHTHHLKISEFFTEMILVCMKYEIVPPDFLFSMAKTMIILNGLNNIFDNDMTLDELLKEQMIEYFIRRSINDCKDFAFDGLTFIPKFINNILSKGVYQGLANEYLEAESIFDNLIKTLNNSKEMLEMFKSLIQELKKKKV